MQSVGQMEIEGHCTDTIFHEKFYYNQCTFSLIFSIYIYGKQLRRFQKLHNYVDTLAPPTLPRLGQWVAKCKYLHKARFPIISVDNGDCEFEFEFRAPVGQNSGEAAIRPKVDVVI